MYLVGRVCADVLKPGVAAGALELAGKVARLVEVVGGLLREVDAVHDMGTSFDKTEGHFKTQATVAAGDETHSVSQRELLREDCRCGIS